MNLFNITEGQEIHGYKNLCRLLEIPYKKNKHHNEEQLQELRKFIDFTEVSSRKIIINRIIKNGILEDKRKEGNNSVYKDDLRLLLLYYLKSFYKKTGEETLLVSRSKLAEVVNLVNCNYRLGQRDIEHLSSLIEVPEEIVYDFYSNNNSKLKSILDRNILNFSKNESLFGLNIVTCVAIFEVCIENNDIQEPKLDIKGNVVNNKKLKFREATDKEIKFINICENKAKDFLEEKYKTSLISFKDIFQKGFWNEYRNLIKKDLNENNIAFYYTSYKIIFNPSIIENSLYKFNKINVEGNLNGNYFKIIFRLSKLLSSGTLATA